MSCDSPLLLTPSAKQSRRVLKCRVVEGIKSPCLKAERGWAHGQQLKQEAGAEEAPRKRFHCIERMRKAAAAAEQLDALCKAAPQVDAPTKLEASAYSAFIKGCLQFECQAWKEALAALTTAKEIYERLASVSSHSTAKELYAGRVAELGPQLRFCAYNIGDKTAVEDLMRMRTLRLGEEGGAGGGGAEVDRLLAATLERQQSGGAATATWGGGVLALSHPRKLASFAAAHRQFQNDLSAAGEDLPTKISLHDALLIELRDAIQAVRDELAKAAEKEAAGTAKLTPAHSTYLTHLRLALSNQRYLLMLQQQSKSKKAKPQDLIRLYDTVLANVGEMEALKEVAADKALCKDLKQTAGYIKAHRALAVAEAYAGLKKWPEAMALFGRAQERAGTAEKLLKGRDLGLGSLGQLVESIKGARQRASAAALLEKSASGGAASNGASFETPLAEDLSGWREWNVAELTGKTPPPLVRLPPPFQPMPAKPLFFDIVLNHIAFPNLEDKIAEPQQQKKDKTTAQVSALNMPTFYAVYKLGVATNRSVPGSWSYLSRSLKVSFVHFAPKHPE